MTEYVCRECTGRGGVLISFEVYEGGQPYVGNRIACPLCGHHGTVMTKGEYEDYREQYD